MGYLTLNPGTKVDIEVPSISMDFPRMKPGFESMGQLLIETAMERIRIKGFQKVNGIVSTMNPNEIIWAEQAGFTLYD